MGFFADGELPDGKLQLFPRPANADPLKYITHTDWNDLCAGVKDLRTNMHKLTTKGDLLVYDGTDYQRLPIDVDDRVLTADSAEDLGVKWAAGGGGGGGTFETIYSSTAADNLITTTSAGGPLKIKDDDAEVVFRIENSAGDIQLNVEVTQGQALYARGAIFEQPSGTTNASLLAGISNRSGLTAATELTEVRTGGANYEWTGGGVWAQQRFMKFESSSIGFTSPTTVPVAATLSITGAPSPGGNATLTAAYPLWVESGYTYLQGGLRTPTIGPVVTQQHTLPAVASDTVALLAASQTFTNKTLTAPVLGGDITGTYELAGTPTLGANLVPDGDNTRIIGSAGAQLNNVYTGSVRAGTGNALSIYCPDDTLDLTAPNIGFATRGITYEQDVMTSGSTPGFEFIGGDHTTLLASNEVKDVYFDLSRTVQHATGAITTQRAFVIDAPTYSFVGASVITNAATLAITGAPATGTNATITNSYALWVQSGLARFDGGIAGFGYIGSSDQAGLGAASTTSTTFVDIGNGSSTGFAEWTTPSIAVARTYEVVVNVVVYMSVPAASNRVSFQLLLDGSAVGGQPTNVSRASLDTSDGQSPISWSIPVALTTGTHTFKLQWKVDSGMTANVNTNSTLQYVIRG